MSEQAGRSAQAVGARSKPYLEYKESGVEWLGEIPAHWDTRPLKALAPFVSRGNGPDYVNDSRISVINQACIYWDGLHLESVKYQEEVDVSGWKGLLHDGDLLLNSTGTGTLGRAALFEGHQGTFIADSHVTIVRLSTQGMAPQYACYLVQTPLYQGYIYAALVSGSTNQIELSREKLRATPVIVPSLPEQHAIVNFLDRETTKIDAPMAKKERLIGLLQEKRTALISQAVTKGLDPNVPMKDSGIGTVGRVPTHWEVPRNKTIFVEVNDRSAAGQEELLTVSHLTGVTPRSAKNVTMFMAESMEGYKVCHKGDLVVNTMWAWMGAVGVTAYQGIVSPSYNVYRPIKEYVPEYLDHVYRTPAYVCEMTRHSKGVWRSRLRLYPESFFEMRSLTPPLPEQREIVQYVGRALSAIDALVDKLAESVEAVTEYRSSLVSAAVTGKIDVRQATP